MYIKDEVQEGNKKATQDAKSLGIFSENQLTGYGEDLSFLLGTNVISTKQGKKAKGKYGKHESYGHNDSTMASLRL